VRLTGGRRRVPACHRYDVVCVQMDASGCPSFCDLHPYAMLRLERITRRMHWCCAQNVSYDSVKFQVVRLMRMLVQICQTLDVVPSEVHEHLLSIL
jgi:hypothetical protein